jgi:perosamine synthetase
MSKQRNNYIPQFEPEVKKRYAKAVYRQIMSTWIGVGPATKAFEDKLKKITKAKHALSCSSGSSAILMAIHALNPPKGSTILFPNYTFIAGANAVKFLGYNVKFIDIKEDTLCMNPDLAEKYIKKNDSNIGIGTLSQQASCVIFVNHNCYLGDDRYRIREICNRYKIPMIEDSAQCLGKDTAGLIGDVGIISFSTPKIIGTGQGGAVLTNDPKIADRCDQARDQGAGWRKTKIHEFIGTNFKFNDICASYGLAQLNEIDKIKKKKIKIFNWYREHIKLLDFDQDFNWMAIYRTKNADKIIEALKENNIQAIKYYKPNSTQPSFQQKDECSVARKMYNELVYLPSSLTLRKKDIDRICKIVNIQDK